MYHDGVYRISKNILGYEVRNMELGKKFVTRMLLGIPFGIAICATISLIINVAMGDNASLGQYGTLSFYVRSYFAAIVIGAVNGGGSIIWDVEKWSWQKKSFIYFGLIFVVFMVSSAYAGWVTLRLEDILLFVGIFVLLYIIISIVMYAYYKRKLKAVNKQIGEKHKA